MWNQNQSGKYESSTPGFPDANIQPRAGYSVGYTPSYDAPPTQYGGHHQTGYQSLAHGTYAPPPGPPPAVSRYDYPSQEHISSYAPPHGPPPPHTGNYPSPDGPPLQPPTERQLFNNSGGATQQHHFMYSQCTGNKKALCIGINYFGQKGQLGGCINDVQNITQFLIAKFGYKQENMVILTDDHSTLRRKPTKENIIQGMKWLVRDAAPNDSLFFHYSGHGGQTKDLDGDEADGYDEVIYPVDYQTNGHILDDLMHDIMVKPIPAGCRLTAIFDSCHSGSVLDLPYVYSTEGKIKEPNLAAEAGLEILSAVSAYARGDMGGVFKSALGLVKTATGGTTKADEYTKKTRTSPADVISWSGCKDSQTSADTQEAGEATGAMSYAFISSLNQNSHQSYQQLLVNIREILRSKYSQKPQLSSSHPMDTRILFIC